MKILVVKWDGPLVANSVPCILIDENVYAVPSDCADILEEIGVDFEVRELGDN